MKKPALSNLVASGHMWLFKLKVIGPARDQGVLVACAFYTGQHRSRIFPALQKGPLDRANL